MRKRSKQTFTVVSYRKMLCVGPRAIFSDIGFFRHCLTSTIYSLIEFFFFFFFKEISFSPSKGSVEYLNGLRFPLASPVIPISPDPLFFQHHGLHCSPLPWQPNGTISLSLRIHWDLCSYPQAAEEKANLALEKKNCIEHFGNWSPQIKCFEAQDPLALG